MNKGVIKEQILQELHKVNFPNLELIFSSAGLGVAWELLWELLEEDKKAFEKLLKIPHSEICFDDFEDEWLLDYYWSLLNHYQWVNNTKVIRDIIETFRPELQDFWNYVAYNRDYFDLLLACEHSLETKFSWENRELLSDQKRAMYLRIKAFKDRGIDLDTDKQNRLKELNKILAKLSNDFTNNISDDESKFSYEITDFECIKNLPKDVLTSVKQGDTYIFSADPTAYMAIMKYCNDSEIRSDFEKVRNSFASKWKYDNRQNILDILKYKNEKAHLLGYRNYAELSLNDKMADSPEQVFELIEWISQKAKTKAMLELDELKTYFQVSDLKSSDIAYYSNIYKEEKYNFDEKELQKYFEYNSVLKYLHDFVKNFYWLELKEIIVPVYNQDVKVYEVYRDSELIAYYLLDPFYRKEKRWGAWADNLREKNILFGKIPVVVNVCNFLKSDPTLLLMRDAETLFHEFWHAIHEMLSVSPLGELSGFWVEWDFVELPSQLLENWVTQNESLEKLAKHYETNEPLPRKMLETLKQLETYMSWNFVVRQNEFALLDMSLYAWDVPESVEELDIKVLALVNKYGIQPRDENYKMYCAFSHIFGWGYSAGYYSYMWAEILEADVFDRIKKMGMFESHVGKKFLNTLLGQGTRKPASELFEDFMWRSVDNSAFMKRKGL